MVSKKDIISGAVDYAEEEMLPKIKDKALAIVIYFFISQLKSKPNLADVFFDNVFVKQLLPETNGMYDVEEFMKAVKTSVKKFGGALSVTIPAIPLLSPSEKELRFTEGDFDDLLDYIVGDDEDEKPESTEEAGK